MKYFLLFVIVIAAFLIGGVIGNLWERQISTAKVDKEMAEATIKYDQMLSEKNTSIANYGRKFEDFVLKTEEFQKELAELREMIRDKDDQLQEAILARVEAEKALGQTLAEKEAAPKPKKEEKKTKDNFIAKAIKMQVEQQFRKRVKKLDEKAILSDFQKAEIDKLITKETDRIIELSNKLFSGELSLEDLMKDDILKKDMFEEGLQGLLTPQQMESYKVVQEEERTELVGQMIKMYTNGTFGVKGMNEVVNLNPEQSQQIQGMLEERFKDYKPNTTGPQRPPMPFDDKEFTEKVRGVLTPEQQPKLEDYIKQQEDFKKMIDGFMPKREPQNNPQ